MDLKIIGQRVRAARKALRLSQEELAKRVDIEQSRISKLENGTVAVSLETMAAIARALGKTVDELTAPRVEHPEGDYQATDPRSKILADYRAPKGLHDLAADASLVEAMKITAEEWRRLVVVDLPPTVTKDGYLQLLITLRAVTST